MMLMDEPTLIRQAQQGDLTSFNRLVLTYQSHAFNIAYRIMGEADAAEDATQEAFISAYRNIKRFRGGSFKSWIFRIVTNACYDELRRRKRRPQTSLEQLSEYSDGFDSEATGADLMGEVDQNPERALQSSELAAAIQDCINHLPPEFRAVVVLVDVQGFDYKEASSIVSSPLGTVKSRLARARVNLRDCLQRFRELLPNAFRLESEGQG